MIQLHYYPGNASLIAVLVDGGLVLYETAAICLHLADAHLNSGLAPAPP